MRVSSPGIFQTVGVLLLTLLVAVMLIVGEAGAVISAAGTVTFYENANSTDSNILHQQSTVPEDLTLFGSLSPAFKNTGTTFTGWNTSPSGSGVNYADGAYYSFASDISLYAQWTSIPVSHTVSFYENDSGSDAVSTYLASAVGTTLTLFGSLSPAFKNTGATFTGWNTSPSGSGVNYADGAYYSFASDISLYAQWTSIPVPVIRFSANNGTGFVADMSGQVGAVILLPSGGGIIESGYSFVGWNTAVNGFGTSYLPGSSYMVNGNQTLYAQWTPLSFNVNYLLNGGMVTSQIATYVVGSPPLTLPNPTNSGFSFDGWFSAVTGGTFVGMGGALFTPASATTLYAQWSQIALNVVSFSANGGTGAVSPLSGGSTGPVVLPSGTGMTESAHNFSGWNSLSNGLGIAYAVGAPFTIGTSQTLFAQWAPDVYVVSFSSEGGNVGSGSVSYTYGTSALTMPVATMTDSTFDGWYTSVNGGTQIGLAGSTYTPTGTITLYAQWTRSIPCTLTFMANGGSGSIGSITVPQGTSVNIPGQKGLLRPGYVVSRWNTNANGRGVSYSIGQSKVITRSQDLYAQWSGHAPAFLLGAVGNFSRGSATLTGALKRHVNAMAIIIKTRKYFTVTLYGYTTPMGMQSLDAAVSRARARSVANYLIRRLAVLKFRGVNIRFSGQGAIAGGTSPIYSRVEVFVQ